MSDEAKLRFPVLAKAASDKVFCYVSMALFVLLPVVEVITEILGKKKVKFFTHRLYPSYFQPYVVGLFGGILAFFVILSFISRMANGKFKLYVADIFFFTLFLFMMLSYIFSVNPGVFAEGSKHYCERPEIFLCYYCLYFAGSMIENPELRKKLLYTYFGVAVLQGVVAFLQTYKIEIWYCLFLYNRASTRASYGLLQNTNFYGALSLVFVASVSGLFIFSSVIFQKKAFFKWIFFAVALLLFYTMLASYSRLAWLGFAGMIGTYIISLLIMRKSEMDKDKLKRITKDFLIMCAGFAAVLIVTYFATNIIKSRVSETAKDTVAKVGEDGFGHGRGRIWRAGIHSIPRHWVTGIGLDNYAQAFRELPDWKKGDFIQSKGHNEYLHTLVTQGVFAFVNYLAVLIYATVNAVKRIINEKDDVKRCLHWIFLTVFAAYACQAILNSSVLNVAPYFWIIIGLLTPRTKPISFKKE
ncbi:O-antigen ligase [Ruminococcaceae bacterium R-25]|nr:O-antigen ligase [Ruminococcaceae bacterium R-25]SUQ22271.1 O-antigen ligase [Oscillospiraceae bacterium]